jgi:hypothetical protein
VRLITNDTIANALFTCIMFHRRNLLLLSDHSKELILTLDFKFIFNCTTQIQNSWAMMYTKNLLLNAHNSMKYV